MPKVLLKVNKKLLQTSEAKQEKVSYKQAACYSHQIGNSENFVWGA